MVARAQTAEPLREGIIVPREAMVRAEGAAWVYEQVADNKFTRREVLLEEPTEKGWFVTKGLRAASKLVIAGAQEILSEEMKEQ